VTDLLFQAQPDKPWWESRFGYTARLGLLAFGIGALIGIPLGTLAAVRHNTWLDYFSLFGATIWYSTPSFVLAIFLMVVFGLWLRWLPIVPRTWTTWEGWVLPSFSLGVGLAAFVARLTRATMLEVLRQDYIRTARAKGLKEHVVTVRHALRNAMVPVATVLGPALAGLITGSFFIEHMFSFPGMGRMFVQAIGARDYSMVLGTTLLYAVLIAMTNLMVDLLYAWLDPRIGHR
jgi:oligopeptide transport system permease protein